MHEPAVATWLLAGAVACAFAGMAWLALSMPVHARQAWGRDPAPARLRLLRPAGALALVASLLLCLGVDHASIAVLVWLMALSGAALAVAMLLSARPGWLRPLAPWIGAGEAQAAGSARARRGA
jgi:hypothetical protein